MTDRVIGRLTVKERAPPPHRKLSSYALTYAFWLCECTCGRTVVRAGKALRVASETASCGCMLSEIHTQVERRRENAWLLKAADRL